MTVGLADGTTGTTVAPLVLNLREESAATALAEIREGALALCVLPWIPLMAGGGEPALIEEWKQLVLRETDEEHRRAYRGIALVFAELTPTLVNWQQGLEGFGVMESQYINSCIRRGEQKGELKARRADQLAVIRVRLANPVPEALRLAVEGTNDPDILGHWFHVALTANSVREFAAEIVTPPHSNGEKVV